MPPAKRCLFICGYDCALGAEAKNIVKCHSSFLFRIRVFHDHFPCGQKLLRKSVFLDISQNLLSAVHTGTGPFEFAGHLLHTPSRYRITGLLACSLAMFICQLVFGEPYD
jgi:hypothetical protein